MQAYTQLKEEIRQLLVRTQVMLIGAIIIAPILFVIEFGPPLIRMLQAGSGLQENYAGQVTSQYIVNILKVASDYSFSKSIIVFIIWAIVGLMAYFAVVSFVRWALSVSNELIVDTQYSRGQAAKLLITHFGQKFLVALVFAIFLVVSFLYLIPYWMDMMRIFVYDMSWINSSLLFLGLLGFITTIYALWSFAYLTWLYEES